MKTIAGAIYVSEQQREAIKRQQEQRDADERQMYDELAASYLRTHKGLDTQTHESQPVVCRSVADFESAFGPTKWPITHEAKIETHNGWWFRYTVHRTVGMAIPENSCSLHRTLKGAQRAARRWKAREYTPTTVAES